MSRPRKLFVHVGLQKTGTSYLQGMLLENRELIARQGLDMVPATKLDAFELMLDIRERIHPGRDPDRVSRSLEKFSEALAAAPGAAAILSQESLAAARSGQLQRFLAACGDREVHGVLTVRDLGRSVPSLWQQELKAGRADSYAEWLDHMQAMQEEGRAQHPWIHVDPVAVVKRWRRFVPTEQLHVITVPASGAAPTLLLQRFAEVVGVDSTSLRAHDRPSNTSLGREQAELLRRVNARLPDEVRRRQIYGDVGKRYFAAQVLSAQSGRRIRVPEERRVWLERTSRTQVEAIRDGGYRVIGSLDELVPAETAYSRSEHPPTGDQIAEAAIQACATMLEMRARDAGETGRGDATVRARDAGTTGGGDATVRARPRRMSDLAGRVLRRVTSR